MSVIVAMVVVNRHATTTLVATPAPVELDMHKMAFMDVLVCGVILSKITEQKNPKTRQH